MKTLPSMIAAMCVAVLTGLSAVAGDAFRLPVPIVWQVDSGTLSRRQYVRDIDYLRANTIADVLQLAPVEGVMPEDSDQFHDPVKELVEYARSKGFRAILRTSPSTKGFFSLGAHPGKNGIPINGPLPCVIEDQSKAQALTVDVEGALDAEGFVALESTAKWNRDKVMPLYVKPLRAWVFDPVGGDAYRVGSLEDVTKRVRIVYRDNRTVKVEIDLGAKYAGKRVFLLAAHYFNSYELYEGADAWFRKLFDSLADVPLSGAAQDETGYMSVNAWGGSAFRGRFWSDAAERHWRDALGTDYARLLFDMRRAPDDDRGIRVRAVNRYWDEFRRVPVECERKVAEYQMAHHVDPFLACHATYHNSLDSDDIVKNACGYWSIPRDYGFTDESTIWPIRLGVLAASREKFGYNMFYSKDPEKVYRNIVECAPFKFREFHHAYNDGKWGLAYREEPFVSNVRRLDEEIAKLDAFQKGVMPRMDVLVVFGEFAHFNWLPDGEKARSRWDVNGSLHVMDKATEIWNAGYRCALMPDRLIEEGRITFKDGKFLVHPGRAWASKEPDSPVAFDKCIFLYPRYAKKATWEFLNGAAAEGASLAVVGPADRDFDNAAVSFKGRRHDAWSIEVLETLGCAKSAIPGGAVYDDGSFALVSRGIIDGKPTAFDFVLDGVRYHGRHTGILACRGGKSAVMTPGGELHCEKIGDKPLEEEFASPLPSARPHVWWHWMNGNVTKEGITADLEAMAGAGIGGAQIFDAGCAIPPGPVKFNSSEWVEMVRHAASEARRLGIELCLANCSGWSSSGGPWISPSNAMKRVVFSEVCVKGPVRFSGILPREKKDNGLYGDIAVLAFPTPAANERTFPGVVSNVDGNTFSLSADAPVSMSGLSLRLDFPWTWNADAKLVVEVSDDGESYRPMLERTLALSRSGDGDRTMRFVPFGRMVETRFVRGRIECGAVGAKIMGVRPEAKMSLSGLKAKCFEVRHDIAEDETAAAADQVVQRGAVLDLTAKMAGNGKLTWDVPEGSWTVLRMGFVCNGCKNRPASENGVGLEVDKLSASAFDFHFEQYVAKVCRALGSLAGNCDSGMNNVLVDSYEVGSQNWTQGLEREFLRRRGYDMTPYLPVFAGFVVGGTEESERFLEDFRRVVADMFSENYAGRLAAKCREYGLKCSIEPYGSCPSDDLEYGSHADIPMCEFWSSASNPYSPQDGNARFAAWIAHVWGRRICAAESFTASPGAKSGRWMTTPFGIKAQSDLAFADGVNRLVYHRFVHQPWTGGTCLPGMTMGRWGMHLDRTQTWWEFASPFFLYQSRCQQLLQRGVFVADVLFFAGEAAPGDGTCRDVAGGKAMSFDVPNGYAFDVCSANALERLSVEDGEVIAPGGVRYRLLAVPPVKAMSVNTARSLLRLVRCGAKIVWQRRPVRSVGLSDGEDGDRTVRAVADEIFAKGVLEMSVADALLKKLSVPPQVVVAGKTLPPDVKRLSWIHRRDETADWFFVAMPNREAASVDVSFRVEGRIPEIWDAESGVCETARVWRAEGKRTVVTVPFEICGSKFVVFRNGERLARRSLGEGGGMGNGKRSNPVSKEIPVAGPWTVAFPVDWYMGGTNEKAVVWKDLTDWASSDDSDIKYFSGIATYSIRIPVPISPFPRLRQGFGGQAVSRMFLDLGEVRDFAEVTVNGRTFPALWRPPYRVDITDALTGGERLDVSVRVANLWPNRLIGDDILYAEDCEWKGEVRRGVKEIGIKELPQWVKEGLPSPTGRHTFTTWKHWDKADGLLASGLLGPVRMVVLSPGAASVDAGRKGVVWQ